jgi:hypothetical protein
MDIQNMIKKNYGRIKINTNQMYYVLDTPYLFPILNSDLKLKELQN